MAQGELAQEAEPAVEELVDGAGGHPGPAGDLGDGEPVGAHFVEEFRAGVEDAFDAFAAAPLHRPAPYPLTLHPTVITWRTVMFRT
ncbi:hypothetical protein GCM10022221_57650 [Actinocorallia aurea]